jgi:hypothetical protein
VSTVPFYLDGPLGGFEIEASSLQYTDEVNGKIEWRCAVSDTGIVGADWSPTADWRIIANGSTSPRLVCYRPKQKTRGGVGRTFLQGQDYISFMLTSEGLSLPTAHNMMAPALINAICARASERITLVTANPPLDNISFASGVSPFPISYVAGPGVLGTMRIEEFDLQNGVLGDYVTNILKDAAFNYRLSRGSLDLFPVTASLAEASPVSADGEYEGPPNPDMSTQVWCRKQSKSRGLFAIPCRQRGINQGSLGPSGLTSGSISVQQLPGGTGNVAYVAVFTGASGSGACCGYFPVMSQFFLGGSGFGGAMALVGPIVPGIAMSAIISCVPFGGVVDLNVIIRGRPPLAFDYDPPFTVTFPQDTVEIDPLTNIMTVVTTADTAPRQKKYLVTSSLWPSQDWLEDGDPSVKELLLFEKNKYLLGKVTRQIPFDFGFLPGTVVPADSDGPKARFDKISMTNGKTEPSMTITGWKYPF